MDDILFLALGVVLGTRANIASAHDWIFYERVSEIDVLHVFCHNAHGS